ncbi:MAG TPA: hypothetical protein VMK84_28680, partial [Streptosporangiaceae bacterium]|nr:hypothetical protein [Streptosporangiaceae bacterium]
RPGSWTRCGSPLSRSPATWSRRIAATMAARPRRARSFRERYDPSARTLRVNIPCVTLAGLATMSGGTAEGGDGDLDG